MEAQNASSLGTEALLAHAGWMRSLAARLVADPERAEDVVQQALVAAIERPPAHAGSVRGWLGRVVANTARQLGRGESRRARRERDSARDEALPSTAELVLEAELQREVVAAILGLDEPYRSTILLRFHRDMAPKRIAELQGVPGATVRSRLSRALAELRSELDRRYGGDRRAWSAGLAPLVRVAGGGEGVGALVSGLVALSVKAKIGLAAAGLAGAALLAWALRPQTPVRPAGLDPAGASPELARLERAEEARVSAVPDADLEAVDEREAVEAHVAGPALATYLGVVRDPDDAPIAGATLTLFPKTGDWRTQEPLGSATSGPDGRFTIEAPRDPEGYAVIQAVAAGFQTSSRDPIVPDDEVELQLSWTTELFGTVVDDPTSAPIAGATVSCRESTVKSDAHGRYRLADVVVGRRIEVSARKDGYAPLDTNLVLGEPVPTEHVIRLSRGVPLRLEVFDAQTGEPLSGAEVVRHAEVLGATDGAGAFAVWIADETTLELEVRAAGYADFRWVWEVMDAAIVSAPRIPMRGLAWIEGVVTDEDGLPLEGCWTYATNPEAPSSFRMPPEEQVAHELPGYVAWDEPDGMETGSDERGRFELGVIPTDTPYSLGCGHVDHVRTQVGPLLLREPGDRVWREVVLRRGATIRGHIRYNGEPWSGGDVYSENEQGERGGFSRIDSDGSYEIENVPPGRVTLKLRDAYARLEHLPTAELVVVAGREYEQDLEWKEELVTIRGTVTARGAPVEDQAVTARRSDDESYRRFQTRTRADGTYELEVVPDATFDVEVYLEPSWVTRDDVPSGAEGIDFELPDVGRLRLVLVDATTGGPVSAGESELWGLAWRPSGAAAFRTVREEIDHDGRVELRLPAGTVDLAFHLTDDGYLPGQVLGVPVTLEGNEDPLVVELERGGALKLVFSGEEPVEAFHGHLVFLLHESQLASLRGPFPMQGGGSNHRINGIHMWVAEPGLLSQMLELDHTGLAVLRGLAPGRYTLRAFPDDFVFEPASFELPDPDPDGGKPTVTIRWRSR